jgi:hypothetical protein
MKFDKHFIKEQTGHLEKISKMDYEAFFSFGLTVSRVGFSVSSIQVNIASTELKIRLATLT